MRLLILEMRRALHRRAVWALIGVALAFAAILGVVAVVDSAGKTMAELRVHGTHPAVLADWWRGGTGDDTLLTVAVLLLIGGLLGGATVAGAEWRAGTLTTVLTWDPRRVRLLVARAGAAFVLATLIAFVLQVLFIAAPLPAALTNGSTAGTTGAWWWALLGAMGRVALLTGITAIVGVSLATLGRNTSFALATAFGWMAVGEGLVRTLRPSVQHHLVGENLATVLTWAPVGTTNASHPTVVAAVLLLAYVGVLTTLATASFARRDIGGAG